MPRANFETGLKACSKCGVCQPIKNFTFHKQTYDRLDTICRECKRLYYHKLFQADPVKYRAQQRARRELNPNYKQRENKWRRAYRKLFPWKEKERNRKYREANKEKIRASQARYRELHPYCPLRRRHRRYNLTPERYAEIMAAQAGKCAGCLRELANIKTCVDHCHATDKVRGILCHPCNISLGLMKDDAVALRRLADYLSDPSQSSKLIS